MNSNEPSAVFAPAIQGCDFFLPLEDYDLAQTLASGQAFRWHSVRGAWEGTVGETWVRLEVVPGGVRAHCAVPQTDWGWLSYYLGAHEDLRAVHATFPQDPPMRAALSFCPGLRLLRQEPWECLASFILSSTKQIVQIQQIVALLCARYGRQLPTPADALPAYSFPSARTLADLTEADLRACKMGFRAPYLWQTASFVADGVVDLKTVGKRPLDEAREILTSLPGVGPKIADCVLLFAYGFQQAFPVDVWVLRALRELYFPRRRPSVRRLREFSSTHFGPFAGYAQQYLFHYVRLRPPAPAAAKFLST